MSAVSEPDIPVHTRAIEEYVLTGSCPQNYSQNQKRYIRWVAAEYFVKNGVLYHDVISSSTQDVKPLQVVHKDDLVLKDQILMNVHIGVGGRHQGVNRMKNKIKENYFWIGYSTDIALYVKKCDFCQKKWIRSLEKSSHRGKKVPSEEDCKERSELSRERQHVSEEISNVTVVPAETYIVVNIDKDKAVEGSDVVFDNEKNQYVIKGSDGGRLPMESGLMTVVNVRDVIQSTNKETYKTIHIEEYLKTGKLPVEYVSKGQGASFKASTKHFTVISNRLFRNPDLRHKLDHRKVIHDIYPEKKLKIILRVHVTDEGIHLGHQKISRIICAKYYWKGLTDDLNRFFRVCQTCSKKQVKTFDELKALEKLRHEKILAKRKQKSANANTLALASGVPASPPHKEEGAHVNGENNHPCSTGSKDSQNNPALAMAAGSPQIAVMPHSTVSVSTSNIDSVCNLLKCVADESYAATVTVNTTAGNITHTSHGGTGTRVGNDLIKSSKNSVAMKSDCAYTAQKWKTSAPTANLAKTTSLNNTRECNDLPASYIDLDGVFTVAVSKKGGNIDVKIKDPNQIVQNHRRAADDHRVSIDSNKTFSNTRLGAVPGTERSSYMYTATECGDIPTNFIDSNGVLTVSVSKKGGSVDVKIKDPNQAIPKQPCKTTTDGHTSSLNPCKSLNNTRQGKSPTAPIPVSSVNKTSKFADTPSNCIDDDGVVTVLMSKKAGNIDVKIKDPPILPNVVGKKEPCGKHLRGTTGNIDNSTDSGKAGKRTGLLNSVVKPEVRINQDTKTSYRSIIDLSKLKSLGDPDMTENDAASDTNFEVHSESSFYSILAKESTDATYSVYFSDDDADSSIPVNINDGDTNSVKEKIRTNTKPTDGKVRSREIEQYLKDGTFDLTYPWSKRDCLMKTASKYMYDDSDGVLYRRPDRMWRKCIGLVKVIHDDCESKKLDIIDRVHIPMQIVEQHDMHLGMNKTVDLIQQRFYWRGMSQDVIAYINKCSCHKADGSERGKQKRKAGIPQKDSATTAQSSDPPPKKRRKPKRSFIGYNSEMESPKVTCVILKVNPEQEEAVKRMITERGGTYQLKELTETPRDLPKTTAEDDAISESPASQKTPSPVTDSLIDNVDTENSKWNTPCKQSASVIAPVTRRASKRIAVSQNTVLDEEETESANQISSSSEKPSKENDKVCSSVVEKKQFKSIIQTRSTKRLESPVKRHEIEHDKTSKLEQIKTSKLEQNNSTELEQNKSSELEENKTSELEENNSSEIEPTKTSAETPTHVSGAGSSSAVSDTPIKHILVNIETAESSQSARRDLPEPEMKISKSLCFSSTFHVVKRYPKPEISESSVSETQTQPCPAPRKRKPRKNKHPRQYVRMKKSTETAAGEVNVKVSESSSTVKQVSEPSSTVKNKQPRRYIRKKKSTETAPVSAPSSTVRQVSAPMITVKQVSVPRITVERAELDVTVERMTEPDVTIERRTEPDVTIERRTEPAVTVERRTEPDVTVQRRTEPDVTVERRTEPVVTIEQGSETVKLCSDVEDDYETMDTSEKEETDISMITAACDVCEKLKTDKRLLEVHSRIHRNVVEACSKCHEEFYTSFYLVLHYETCHNRAPFYKCDICKAKYSHKKFLKNEMFLGGSLLFYSCAVCVPKFVLKR